jgi:hypothetical protein
MVHTVKVPLTELYLGTSPLRIPQDDEEPQYELEWHPAGSSLYITVPDFAEIDLRFDREVFEIFVGTIILHLKLKKSAFILFSSSRIHCKKRRQQ